MVGVRVVATPSTSTVAKVEPSRVETQNAEIVPEVPAPVAVKKSLFDNIDFSKPPPGLLPAAVPQIDTSEPPPPGTEGIPPRSNQGESGPSSSSTQDTLAEPTPIPKPPVDLFKEIFADTSESEDETETTSIADSKRDKINTSPKSNYAKRFDQTSAEKNFRSRSAKGNETPSQIKSSYHQKDLSNSELALKPNENHKASAELKNKEIKDKDNESFPFSTHTTPSSSSLNLFSGRPTLINGFENVFFVSGCCCVVWVC